MEGMEDAGIEGLAALFLSLTQTAEELYSDKEPCSDQLLPSTATIILRACPPACRRPVGLSGTLCAALRSDNASHPSRGAGGGGS